MSWEKVTSPDERDKLLQKAEVCLPDWGEWKPVKITENNENGRSRVVFRDTTDEKVWVTVWFKDGEPHSFTYYRKLGE